MINKWILNNFKSINKETELEFRPLTIFTGANSSGKSTVLQSILLVTQTLQDHKASRSIVLNGSFKKFGSYSDIVNNRDVSKKIKFGFSLANDVDNNESLVYPFIDKVDKVACNFEIASDKNVEIDGEDLQPSLDNLHVKVLTDDTKDGLIDLSREPQLEKNKKVIESLKHLLSDDNLQYRVNVSNIKMKYGYMGHNTVNYIGADMFHFLPNFLISYYNKKDRYKMFIREMIVGGNNYTELPSSDETQLNSIVKDLCLKFVDEISNLYDVNKNNNKLYKDRLTDNFRFKIFQRYLKISNVDANKKQEYADELIKLVNEIPDSYSLERYPSFLYPGFDFIKEFFSSNIRYLGPLREEPKSLYPLDDNGSRTEVGLKGEHTAAVYEECKNNKISYIDPDDFDNPQNLILEKKSGSLSEAVNKWLVYLGVAKTITTDDKGKFGHELKITNEIEGMKQDLTHVGVGVSQILPILVMSFLAKAGDVVILEQPELHLHPKVQTRLADFFVAMNALGKQCIVDTHSEYLINRLRLLVVKSDDTRVADETMIYFVEKDKMIGRSNYRKVIINPYGKIEHWPEGFFDEGENLASQIIEAAFDKKRREKQKMER